MSFIRPNSHFYVDEQASLWNTHELFPSLGLKNVNNYINNRLWMTMFTNIHWLGASYIYVWITFYTEILDSDYYITKFLAELFQVYYKI